MQKLVSILLISTLIFSSTEVFAQQLKIGEPPIEDIKVAIDENGTAHVIHAVKGDNTRPVNVEMIKGNVSNFSVMDSDGNSVQYFTTQQSPMSIMLSPTDRNMTLIKYDLVHTISFDNGVWKWNYHEPSDITFTDFYFPKGVDMIWSNNRPVYLGEHGLRQHGNGFNLEYIIGEPTTPQTVQWQDKQFTVGIRTLSGLGTYVFDQSAKSYSFDINTPNSFVTVIIPQELLWGPYEVTINGNKTLHTQFHNNGTHVWMGLGPLTNGTVQITGTTVIPEFPLFVPLAIAISAVVILRFTNRLSFH